ncbi:MAG TPA: hypothetical protein VHZ50_01405 [Puia sp.]|jgi:hypothetical protein|nr:hypothetical protein [Puia sp.]
MNDLHFDINVDGVPYDVTATPYDYNSEPRFYVSFNGSEQYVFAWDAEMKRLTAIGDGTADIPDDLEEAISAKLLSHKA